MGELLEIGGAAIASTELDLTEVHRAHADYLWATLARLGASERDRGDLLQEVLLVVHRRRADFDPKRRLRPWLYGICVRVVSNQRRRAYVRREEPMAELPRRLDVSTSNPEREVAAAEQREAAERLLAKLDPEKRAVFVMFEVEQLSCPQIAAQIGVPVGTVYSRLHAARAAVARLLQTWRST